MPTYDFNEKIDQRSVTRTQGQRVLQRVYQLEVSERITEAEADAYVRDTGTGYPGLAIGSAYPDLGGDGAILTSVVVEDDAIDGRSWKVTAQWSSPSSGGLGDDPFSRPAEFEWSSDRGTENVFTDYAGDEIVNTAGFPFDSLPQREVAYVQVQMTRNETTTFFRSTVLPLMGFFGYAVNTDSFTIDGVSIGALKARLLIRSASKITEGTVTFYRVTYVVQLRNGLPGYESDGWRERYQSRGHYCLGDSGGAFADPPHPARDADGQIIEEAVPLDASGFYLGDPTDAPAVVGPFQLYKEVAFASLGFS